MRKESATAHKARKEKAAQLAKQMRKTLEIMEQQQLNMLPSELLCNKDFVKSMKRGN